MITIFEPQHDKTNKVAVHPAKTQISLGICPVWSESSLSAWRKLGPLATQWAHSEDSDQTGRMPRLIWVFAGCTVILLVLSWGLRLAHSHFVGFVMRWLKFMLFPLSNCNKPHLYIKPFTFEGSSLLESYARKPKPACIGQVILYGELTLGPHTCTWFAQKPMKHA